MNDTFIWKDEYSVGVQQIDEQHRHFFEVANELFGMSEDVAASRETFLAETGKLGDYALYHLGTEEEYFDKFHYEEAAAHIAAHDQYREKITDYLSRIRDEKNDVKKFAADISLFSSDWLRNHIIVMDKKYTQCFHQNGLH